MVFFLISRECSCHFYVAGQFVIENKNSAIVTGVNLPMLVSLLLTDKQETDPHILAKKAQQYGKAGIYSVDKNNLGGVESVGGIFVRG